MVKFPVRRRFLVNVEKSAPRFARTCICTYEEIYEADSRRFAIFCAALDKSPSALFGGGGWAGKSSRQRANDWIGFCIISTQNLTNVKNVPGLGSRTHVKFITHLASRLAPSYLLYFGRFFLIKVTLDDYYLSFVYGRQICCGRVCLKTAVHFQNCRD